MDSPHQKCHQVRLGSTRAFKRWRMKKNGPKESSSSASLGRRVHQAASLAESWRDRPEIVLPVATYDNAATMRGMDNTDNQLNL